MAKEPLYIALRPLNLADGKIAQIGDPVPGAHNWPNLRAWVDNGDVRPAYPGEGVDEPEVDTTDPIDHGASPIQTPDGPLRASQSAEETEVVHQELDRGIVADDPSPIQTPERSKEAAAAIKSGDAVAGKATDVDEPAPKPKRKSTAKKSAAKSTAKRTTAKTPAKRSSAKAKATPTSAPGKAPKGTSGEIVNNVDSPIQTPERSRASAAKRKGK